MKIYIIQQRLIFKMYALQKIISKKEKQFYQLQYAFERIKHNHFILDANYVSFKNLTSKNTHGASFSMHSVEVENKELYLNYIEQVLRKKEQDLLEFEEYLNRKQEEHEQERMNQKIINPLAINHFAQLITKKIETLKEIILKFSTIKTQNISAERQLQTFHHNLLIVQEACRKNYEILQNQMIKDYEQLNIEKQQFALKLSKLAELESYEKYLNEFQVVLQRKQNEIVLQQKQFERMKQKIEYSLNKQVKNERIRSYEQENTYNDGDIMIQIPNDQSQSTRKRARIFQNKSIESRSRDKDKRSDILHLPPSSMIQSSKIMAEEPATHYSNQKKSLKAQASNQPSKDSPSQVQSVQKTSQSIGSQTFVEHRSTSNRLDIEKQLMKYLRFWFIFSRRNSKGDLNHKKTMSMYLWRLNALYDDSLKQKIQENLNWPKKVYHFNHITNVNYEDLSLRKKKYLQKFFKHEMKSFHRQKILFSLKMILKNINRRQRTAVVLYFKKYRHNIQLLKLSCLINTKKQVLSQKPIDYNHQSMIKTENHKILSKSSTSNKIQNTEQQHLNQKKMVNKTSTKSIPSDNNSKSKLAKDVSNANIDMNKLKQYIKNQEEVEAKLAIQCCKTESVFRMQSCLNRAVTKISYLFLFNIMKIAETNKINMLQKSINSAEFKWQLFMAKARLALTNNANKISHLQQLISFI